MGTGAAARAVFLSGAALGAAFAGTPADARYCRLALVLAIDVSSSVDEREDRLQRAGLMAALRSPEIARAVLDTPGSVALHAFEWSGTHHQGTLLDWTIIETPADLEHAATAIGNSLRQRDDLPTAIGNALGHAAAVLKHAPDCDFRKVDVSGDGPNNDGYAPSDAYRAFNYDDVTVNGLPILGAGSDDEIDLVGYYRTEVLHGPGAFLETADGFDDFARAIRRKLLRELKEQTLG